MSPETTYDQEFTQTEKDEIKLYARKLSTLGWEEVLNFADAKNKLFIERLTVSASYRLRPSDRGAWLKLALHDWRKMEMIILQANVILQVEGRDLKSILGAKEGPEPISGA